MIEEIAISNLNSTRAISAGAVVTSSGPLLERALAAKATLGEEKQLDSFINFGEIFDEVESTFSTEQKVIFYSKMKIQKTLRDKYVLLYRDRNYVQDGLDWADRTSHKYAGYSNIDCIIKILSDYRAKVLGNDPPVPKKPWTPKPVTTNEQLPGRNDALEDILVLIKRDVEELRLELETAPFTENDPGRSARLTLVARLEDRIDDIINAVGPAGV